jgi:hypothetical protein
MVPNVTKGGASFKGAAAYYLHDREAETASRRVGAFKAGSSTP